MPFFGKLLSLRLRVGLDPHDERVRYVIVLGTHRNSPKHGAIFARPEAI